MVYLSCYLFFSQEKFGFGYNLSKDVLYKINEKRSNQNYKDEEAAISVTHSKEKKPLTESPFLTYLEFGSNHEGYWDYNHMVLQLEYCIDCMKILYP